MLEEKSNQCTFIIEVEKLKALSNIVKYKTSNSIFALSAGT
jgi:hypothetical protein